VGGWVEHPKHPPSVRHWNWYYLPWNSAVEKSVICENCRTPHFSINIFPKFATLLMPFHYSKMLKYVREFRATLQTASFLSTEFKISNKVFTVILGHGCAMLNSWMWATTSVSNTKDVWSYSWTVLPLKMGPIGCSETSVTNYQSTLGNIPEQRRSQALSCLSFVIRFTRHSLYNCRSWYRVVKCHRNSACFHVSLTTEVSFLQS
jgi:hypothetical protein